MTRTYQHLERYAFTFISDYTKPKVAGKLEMQAIVGGLFFLCGVIVLPSFVLTQAAPCLRHLFLSDRHANLWPDPIWTDRAMLRFQRKRTEVAIRMSTSPAPPSIYERLGTQSTKVKHSGPLDAMSTLELWGCKWNASYYWDCNAFFYACLVMHVWSSAARLVFHPATTTSDREACQYLSSHVFECSALHDLCARRATDLATATCYREACIFLYTLSLSVLRYMICVLGSQPV